MTELLVLQRSCPDKALGVGLTRLQKRKIRQAIKRHDRCLGCKKDVDWEQPSVLARNGSPEVGLVHVECRHDPNVRALPPEAGRELLLNYAGLKSVFRPREPKKHRGGRRHNRTARQRDSRNWWLAAH